MRPREETALALREGDAPKSEASPSGPRAKGRRPAEQRYAAFISYNRAADSKLARVLKGRLEAFTGSPLGRRRLRIYLDNDNLPMTDKLWTEISTSIERSDFFLLLASPESRESPWVERELTHFLATHDRSRVGILLTAGATPWTDPVPASKAPQWAVSSRVLGAYPDANDPPLVMDLRDNRPDRFSSTASKERFVNQLASIYSRITGRPKDEIYGEHIRKQRQVIAAISVVLVALVVLSASVAVALVHAREQEQQAEAQREVADTQRAAAIQRSAEANQARAEAEDALRQKDSALQKEKEARLQANEQSEKAREQAAIARAARQLSDRSLAERTLATAEAYAALDDWRQANNLYAAAERLFEQNRMPAMPITLAKWRTLLAAPPPLSSFETSLTSRPRIAWGGHRIFAADDKSESVSIYDAERGQLQTAWPLPSAGVAALHYSEASARLYVGATSGNLLIFDATGKLLQTLHDIRITEQDHIIGISATPDGSDVAVAHQDGAVAHWKPPSTELIRWDLEQKTRWGSPFALGPGGEWITGTRTEGAFTKWNLDFLAPMKPLSVNWPLGGAAVITPNVDLFWGEARQGGFVRHDFQSGLTMPPVVTPTKVEAMASSADARMLVTGEASGDLSVWSRSASSPTRHFVVHAAAVSDVVLSDDGEAAASVDTRGAIHVWRTRALAPVARFEPLGLGRHSLALSPDGSYFASVGDANDPTLRVWDIHSGRLLETKKLGASGARAVFIDRAEQLITSGTSGLFVHAPDGSERRLLPTWGSDKQSHRLLRSGLIAQIDREGKLDVAALNGAGASPATAVRLATKVTAVAASESPPRLLVGDESGNLTVIAHPGNEVKGSLHAADGPIVEVVEGPSMYVVTTATGALAVIDRESLRVRWTSKVRPVLALRLYDGGQTLVTVAANGQFGLWETSSGKLVQDFNPLGKPVLEATFSADGGTVATVADDGGFLVLRLALADELFAQGYAAAQDGLYGAAQQSAFASARRRWLQGVLPERCNSLLSEGAPAPRSATQAALCSWMNGDSARAISLLDAAYPQDTSRPAYAVRLRNAVMNGMGQGRLVGMATAASLTLTHDTRSLGKVLLVGPDARIAELALSGGAASTRRPPSPSLQGWVATGSPSGDAVLIADTDGRYEAWPSATSSRATRGRARRGKVNAVALSDDQQRAGFGFDDGVVSIIDLASGRSVAQQRLHRSPVTVMAFGGRGGIVISASESGEVVRWDTPSNATVRALGHEAAVRVAALSTDGNLLATGSDDGTVLMWEAAALKAPRALLGHKAAVAAALYVCGGRLLATASRDRSIMLWDLQAHRRAALLRGHATPVVALAHGASEDALISVDDLGEVREWAVASWCAKSLEKRQ